MDKFNLMDQLSDEDKAKLDAYTKHLETFDPRQALMEKFNKQEADRSRAMDIATRSPFADKTPEEQEFEEKNLDPMTRGMIQGGVMGSIAKVPGATKAAGEVMEAFPKLKQMFQVGSHEFEAGSTAEAMKIKNALEKQGLTMPGRSLIKK